MKEPSVDGPFCANLAVTVIHTRWPHLVHGRDYLVMQAVEDNGDQKGPPWFMFWRAVDVEQPTMEELEAEFNADQLKCRATLARDLRNAMLELSDTRVYLPDDAPEAKRASVNTWKAYRDALRNIPNQAGFPMDIEWPDPPI
jgi:hypothetical protein